MACRRLKLDPCLKFVNHRKTPAAKFDLPVIHAESGDARKTTAFPTDYYSNWQWWYLIPRAGSLRLDLLPSGLKPIVRVIDDWVTARPLALVMEGRIGAGKIIVCGFNLTDGTDDPVSRQMRQSLLD